MTDELRAELQAFVHCESAHKLHEYLKSVEHLKLSA